MRNIFANAKFGDKFRTRDGRIVKFIKQDLSWMEYCNICSSEESLLRCYSNDGYCKDVFHAGFDIVDKL